MDEALNLTLALIGHDLKLKVGEILNIMTYLKGMLIHFSTKKLLLVHQYS